MAGPFYLPKRFVNCLFHDEVLALEKGRRVSKAKAARQNTNDDILTAINYGSTDTRNLKHVEEIQGFW
jgi:hypothetical protein